MHVKNKLRGALRRLTETPLRMVGQGLQAEVLERVSGTMIATVPIPDRTLHFYAPNPLLQRRAAAILTKEPDLISWMEGFSKDAVFWDIGANVGAFSLYAAARTGCRVLAFEPAAANFHVLARNIELNDLAARIDGYCLALSGSTRLGVLNLASAEMGASLSQFGAPGETSLYWGGAPAGVHGMISFTVDQFIEQFEPPFPMHIKIDVDGLELSIIEGAKRTLRDSRLRSVMLELSISHQNERNHGIALMKAAGFRCVSQGEPQSTETESAANHLFVR